MATNIVNLAETYGAEFDSIKFLRVDSCAKLPRKATSGSAVYDLFAANDHTIPLRSRLLIPTGLSCEIPLHICGQIWSRSGLSSRNLLDVAAGVIDSDYRGILEVLLHNQSE
jgi:dUTP pyrophosphatase